MSEATRNLIVDHWRLLRTLARVGEQLPEAAARRIAGQVRYQQGRLDTVLTAMEIELITYEGRPFDGSIPPIAQNADEVGPKERLIVIETLEPTLVSKGQVVHGGRVNIGQEL